MRLSALKRVRSYGSLTVSHPPSLSDSEDEPESSTEDSDEGDEIPSVCTILRSRTAMRECRRILAQAAPQAFQLFLANLNTAIVTIILGRQSSTALATVGFTNAVLFGSALLISGTLAAVPVLAAQACIEAEKHEDAGNTGRAEEFYWQCGGWLRAGVAVALGVLVPPVGALWYLLGDIIGELGVTEIQGQVGELAGASILWLPAFALSVALTGWLEALSGESPCTSPASPCISLHLPTHRLAGRFPR